MAVDSFSVFAPAKLNLFLAVTGRRPDGFHDLVSLAAPLDFGDTLRAERAPGFSLRCDDPEVPGDETNLVLKAARGFTRVTGWKGGAAFVLEKRIPMGAGLGGGSSNAVAALRLLNEMAGPEHGIAAEGLSALAAELGSDCPLFLSGRPVIMRGRGELVDVAPESATRRLRGREVLLFKPAFGIGTPWAYGQLAAAGPASYLPSGDAELRLAAWLEDPAAPVERLLFNSLEQPAFAKFLALPGLLEDLGRRFGLEARMSGSGSACLAFLSPGLNPEGIVGAIREAWGDSAFVVKARLA